MYRDFESTLSVLRLSLGNDGSMQIFHKLTGILIILFFLFFIIFVQHGVLLKTPVVFTEFKNQ